MRLILTGIILCSLVAYMFTGLYSPINIIHPAGTKLAEGERYWNSWIVIEGDSMIFRSIMDDQYCDLYHEHYNLESRVDLLIFQEGRARLPALFTAYLDGDNWVIDFKFQLNTYIISVWENNLFYNIKGTVVLDDMGFEIDHPISQEDNPLKS